MPRSDGGRAAARGGLKQAPKTTIQALRTKFENRGHETCPWSFPQPRIAPPRHWRGTAVPRQCPPLLSPRRGLKTCNPQSLWPVWVALSSTALDLDLGAAFARVQDHPFTQQPCGFCLHCVSVAGRVPRSCSQRRFVPKELPQPACG